MAELTSLGSRFGHWTPRYVVDRAKDIVYQRRHPDAPWLTPAITHILDALLRSSDCGLEWGAGRSTVWLAHRVRHLTTIEENQKWGDRVAQTLDRHGISDRVDLNLVSLNSDDGAAATYITIASKIAPRSLDFCLIDGALRDWCVRAALPMLKPGGLLLIDNVERYVPREHKSRTPNARSVADGFASEVWRQAMEEIADWRSIWTSNGVWDTALWIKP